MLYGCSVWSLTTDKNKDTITILQKKCLRILNFAPYNSHTNQFFILDKIIKFTDIIVIGQLKLIFKFKQNALPSDLLNLFNLNSDISSQNSRNVSNEGIFIPRIFSTDHGNKSLKFSAPSLWNNYIKDPEFCVINNFNTLKIYLKKIFLKSYAKITDNI